VRLEANKSAVLLGQIKASNYNLKELGRYGRRKNNARGVAKVRAGGNRFGVRRLATAFAGPACWPALRFNLD